MLPDIPAQIRNSRSAETFSQKKHLYKNIGLSFFYELGIIGGKTRE